MSDVEASEPVVEEKKKKERNLQSNSITLSGPDSK